VELGVLGPAGECTVNVGARFEVTSKPVQRPGEQVVAVHVAALATLGACLGEHAPSVGRGPVVEHEHSPRAMDRTRLMQRVDGHGARVLGGTRAVAERGPGIADRAERRRIELDGDGAIAVRDALGPSPARRGDARERTEDAIVGREDREPATER